MSPGVFVGQRPSRTGGGRWVGLGSAHSHGTGGAAARGAGGRRIGPAETPNGNWGGGVGGYLRVG